MTTYEASNPTSALWLDYEFSVYHPDAFWYAVPGLYIFAKLMRNWQGTPYWRALYVGQAKAFSDRLYSHERWDEAVQLGATCVHALVMTNAFLRTLIEQELIETFQPPLNVQLRKPSNRGIIL